MRKVTFRSMPLVLAACSVIPASASDPSVQLIASDQINAPVPIPSTGAAARQMLADSTTAIWVITRDKAGDVELHQKWNDVIIARDGSVDILVGEKVNGNHEIKPTEWIGGTIVAGKTYSLKAGDMLFIRAGMGHQMTPTGHKPFNYLVIKTQASASQGSNAR